MAGETKVLYTDKGTFLKTGRDRSSVMPVLLASFFLVGTALTAIFWMDILMLIVGVVGMAANLVMLYLIRRNDVGPFEIDTDGIRFPKPREDIVRFSDIKRFRTKDERSLWVLRIRYMEIEEDDGSVHVISDRRIPGSDYVSSDFAKIERIVRDRWNDLNR